MTGTSKALDILVSAGSRHGATAEIARRIGKTIEQHGARVTVQTPEEVTDLESFDAIVLGSAVYAGHWTTEAKELAARVAGLDARPPVWIFSSGPVGDPPKPEEDPVDVTEIMEQTRAKEHHVFAGKIDKSKLGFAEKAILVAVRAAEGDYRNWDAIDAWASSIAESLAVEVSKE